MRILVEFPLPNRTLPSATLNEWQDRTAEADAANKNNNLPAGDNKGGTRLRWVADTQIPDGGMRRIDTSADWRDRWVKVLFVRTGATQRFAQGGAPGDTALNDVSSAGPARSTSEGYLGTGAYGNVASGARVEPGVPPVAAVGSVRSYAIVVDDLGNGPVYLFASPVDGSLWLYNNSGSALWPFVEVDLSDWTGKRE